MLMEIGAFGILKAQVAYPIASWCSRAPSGQNKPGAGQSVVQELAIAIAECPEKVQREEWQTEQEGGGRETAHPDAGKKDDRLVRSKAAQRPDPGKRVTAPASGKARPRFDGACQAKLPGFHRQGLPAGAPAHYEVHADRDENDELETVVKRRSRMAPELRQGRIKIGCNEHHAEQQHAFVDQRKQSASQRRILAGHGRESILRLVRAAPRGPTLALPRGPSGRR